MEARSEESGGSNSEQKCKNSSESPETCKGEARNKSEDYMQIVKSIADNCIDDQSDEDANNNETKEDEFPRQMSFAAPTKVSRYDPHFENRCTDDGGLPVFHPKESALKKAMHWRRKNKRSTVLKDQKRVMTKEGETKVLNTGIKSKGIKYIEDLFTTLLDIRWRYCLLIFTLAFVLSWLFFAVIYYVICIVHEDHIHFEDPDWKPCHSNVYDFSTAFLFSLESQHTIGYGYRGMEPNCAFSIIILAIQSCCGAFFQCIVTGIVFAKLARPKHRADTIMFSKKAVISQVGHSRFLLFRIGDMRKTHITATSIRAILVRNELTSDGNTIPICQYPLHLHVESCLPEDNFLFLQWPEIVSHHINSESPLWDVSSEDLSHDYFEVIVILEGTVAETGMTTQIRTSYLASEIAWLHRLAPLLTYRVDANGYRIDHTLFHETIPQSVTSDSSAHELHKEWKEDQLKQSKLRQQAMDEEVE